MSAARDDYDAVIIGDNNVARTNRYSGANDRNINRAERRFHCPLCGYGPRPNRETHFFKSGNVPGASVNYQAAHTARLQRSREKLAEHSVGIVRRAGDDEHIAGATLLRRNVDHPISCLGAFRTPAAAARG
jgi:hypothetical protein